MNKKTNKTVRAIARLELLEPRMLLSADALALSGLPGVDYEDKSAPWDDANQPDQYESSTLLSPLAANARLPDIDHLFINDQDQYSQDNSNEYDVARLSEDDNDTNDRQLVFIDTAIRDYAALINDIKEANTHDEIIMHLIDSDRDGVQQITEVLAHYSDISAVHIVSHSNAEAIAIGNQSLSNTNLDQSADYFRQWSSSMTANADILFYGCELAADSAGRDFLHKVATMTQADVAASNDLTGASQHQGDWDLEYRQGVVTTETLVSASKSSWQGVLETATDEGNGNTDNATTDKPDLNATGTDSGDYEQPGLDPLRTQTTVSITSDDAASTDTKLTTPDEPTYDNAADYRNYATESLNSDTTGSAQDGRYEVTADARDQQNASSPGDDGDIGSTAVATDGQIQALDEDELIEPNSTTNLNESNYQGNEQASNHSVKQTQDTPVGSTQAGTAGAQTREIQPSYYPAPGESTQSNTNVHSDHSNTDESTDTSSADSSRIIHAPSPSVAATANQLWFGASNDVGAGNGVPGLNASGWQNTDILTVGDPNFSVGDDTDGVFDTVFDIADFSTGTQVSAMHLVSQDITIGATNQVMLQQGDLMLTVSIDGSALTSNGSTPEATLTVNNSDIVYFRPDTVGNYSIGNFFTLLNDPFGNGLPLQAFTLVEHDVTTGDIILPRGTLLLAGVGANTNSIYAVSTAGIDPTVPATYNTPQLYLDGDSNDVDIDEDIMGLDILEVQTTIGGTTYIAGTLLMTLADDDSNVGENSHDAKRPDILIARVNATTIVAGAGNESITAQRFFDSSDVNFNGADENMNALTVASIDTMSAPQITVNNLSLTQSDLSVQLTSSNLSATDDNDLQSDITYNVAKLSNGYFANVADLNSAIFSFDQAEIDAGDVYFQFNGGELSPTYSLTAQDSDGLESDAVQATINFTPDATGALLLGFDTGFGAINAIPGLIGIGTDGGDVLQFAGPNLELESPNTNGVFSHALDLTSGAQTNSAHFVSQDTVIGGINPVTLLAGDILLTTKSPSTTLTSNGSNPPASVSVSNNDIYYFRPDVVGDYTQGNFYLLLEDVTPAGNLLSLSLIEDDVTIADTSLQQGDIVFTQSADGGNKINVLDTSTLDTTDSSTYPSYDILMDGADTDIDVTNRITGLDVVEQDYTIGGKTYTSGTILLAIETSDTNGVGTNDVTMDIKDIVALNLTATTLGSGVSSGTAGLFFNASNVNFLSFGSNFTDTVSLTATTNSTPIIGNNTVDVTQGLATSVTPNMLSATDRNDPNASISYSITAIAGGVFEFIDTGSATTTFTQGDIDSGNVRFVDDGNAPAPTFAFTLSDGVATSTNYNGGLNYTPVNNPTSATNVTDTIAYTEDDLSVAINQIVVSDPDAGEIVTATLTLANTAAGNLSSAAGSGYTFSNGVYSITGTVATVNTALSTLSFAPAANFDLDTTIDVVIDDDDEDLSGSVNGTITLDVTPTNDAPNAGPTSVNTTEDAAAYVVDLLATSSDDDTSDVLSIASVTLTGGDSTGIVVNGNGTLSVDPSQYNNLAAGETATITYDYVVTDGLADSIATATIVITGVNDQPVSNPIISIRDEDAASYTIDMQGNASDADDNDTLAIQNVVLSGNTAGVSDNGDGTLSVDPGAYNALALGESEVITVTYDVSDGATSVPGSVTVTINGVNDAPVNTNIITTRNEDDVAYSVDMLANASDSDGSDTLSVQNVSITGASTGVVDNGNGTLSIDPGAYDALAVGESETITISYDVSDGTTSVPGSVTVTINGVNDAPSNTSIATTSNEDDTAYSINMLANASDSDSNDTLSVQNVSITGASTGVIDNGDGTLSIDPGAYNVLALGESEIITVSYDVNDGTTSVPGSVTVTINGVNDAPSNTSIATTSDEDDTAYSINMLANASDSDSNDSLNVQNVSITGVSTGVVDNGDGTLSIDPGAYSALALGESEVITVSYDVNDGTTSVPGSVTVTINGINDAPVNTPIVDSRNEDAPAYVIDMLGNASDVDTSDTLTVQNVVLTGDVSGILDNGNGTLSIDPSAYNALAMGESEVITISYDISDGTTSVPGSVTVTINGVNDAPVNTPIVDSRNEEASAYVIDMLGNASDVDTTDTLTVQNVVLTGNLSGILDNGNGTLSIDPSVYNALAVGETEVITVNYDVSDGTTSVPGSVTVTINGVNDVPTNSPIVDSHTEDAPAYVIDMLGNASDVDTSDTLTVQNVVLTGNLSGVTDNGDGTLSIDPGAYNALAVGESEVITVSYDVNDGTTSVPGSVTVTISGVNDAPSNTSIVTTRNEDDAAYSINMLANSSDIDSSDSLNVQNVSITGVSTGVVDNGDGTLSIDPGAYNALAVGESEVIAISYDISDGLTSVPGSVTVTINGVNDAPVNTPIVDSRNEDSPAYVIDMLGNASDVDTNDTLAVQNVVLTGNLSGILDNGNGTLSVDPSAYNALAVGESEVITISYDVSDGATSVPGSVTVTINGVNDAPSNTSIVTTRNEDDATYSIDMLANASDADSNDTLSVQNISIAGTSTGVIDNGDGTLSIDPSAYNALALGETEVITVSYDISDGTTTTPGVVVISIDGANDTPIATPLIVKAVEDELPLLVDLLSAATDDDTSDVLDAVNLTYISGDSGGITIGSDGTLTLDPGHYQSLGNGETATILYNYEVSDTHTTTTTSLEFILKGKNDAPNATVNFGTIEPGATFTLTPDMLTATDIDDIDSELQITISNVSGGQIQINGANVATDATFTQSQLIAGDIVFIDDGDGNSPTMIIDITDGLTTVRLLPEIGLISTTTGTGPVTDTPSPIDNGPDGEPEGAEPVELEPESEETLNVPIVADPVIPGFSDIEPVRDTTLPDDETDKKKPTKAPSTNVAIDQPVELSNDTLIFNNTDKLNFSVIELPAVVEIKRSSVEYVTGDNLQGRILQLLTELIVPKSLDGVQTDRFTVEEFRSLLTSSAFVNDLDKVRDNYNGLQSFQRTAVGSAVVLSSSLSIGYVAWLLRGGILLSTVLSSLPAWQIIDPLPILAKRDEDDDDDDDDQDELETMFAE